MTEVRENGSTVIASLSYNAQGQRASASRAGGASTAYAYDPVGRLQTLTQELAGTAADLGSTFTWTPASQMASVVRSNEAYVFSGDVNVNRSYAVNGLNQYTTAGPATFAYDGSGNLTSDGSVTLAYDNENRLRSASGAKTASLLYDPMGRLWQTSGGSAGTTRFLYDGDALVAEYNGSNQLLRRYVHGPGVDEPLIWYEGAGLADRRTLHADHQGSIVAVGNSTGASLAINSYDAWGIPGANNLGRFQYTGQILLPEIEFYHYKARIYSPTLGRFLQTDPIGYDDQVNLYAYVNNDPLNQIDPDGQDSVFVGMFGRPLGPGYGHAYTVLHNRDTGQVYVVQGAPSPAYPGGSSGAASDRPARTTERELSLIQARVVTSDKAGEDNLQTEGTEFFQGRVLPDANWDNLIETSKSIVEGVNGALTPYTPLTNNSNRLAGDVYEELTGEEPSDAAAGRVYPGLEGGNLPRCGERGQPCP